MEIPQALKDLYRHWNLHAERSGECRGAFGGGSKKILEDIGHFVHERMAIWQKKTAGGKPPYTEDPILARYRFCNIFREFDRQTIAFHALLNPLRGDLPAWLLNMFYCRMVARPETIASVGLLSFDDAENHRLKEGLLASPRPRFGTPYVFPVSVIQRSPYPTRESFIAEFLPKAMPAVAEEMLSWQAISVYDALKRTLPIFGYNLPFLWTETLIDAAYQFPERIDLFGRFPIGPGAMPTFARIDPKADPSILAQRLCSFPLETGVTFDGKPVSLSAENWEGIGCEFRKYTNLRHGAGRKRIYRAFS